MDIKIEIGWEKRNFGSIDSAVEYLTHRSWENAHISADERWIIEEVRRRIRENFSQNNSSGKSTYSGG